MKSKTRGIGAGTRRRHAMIATRMPVVQAIEMRTVLMSVLPAARLRVPHRRPSGTIREALPLPVGPAGLWVAGRGYSSSAAPPIKEFLTGRRTRRLGWGDGTDRAGLLPRRVRRAPWGGRAPPRDHHRRARPPPKTCSRSLLDLGSTAAPRRSGSPSGTTSYAPTRARSVTSPRDTSRN